MGYVGSLVSDFRESLVSPRKLYKSLSDSPSYTDRGYRFAYNLGTVSAATGLDTKALRGGIYEGLQRSRDIKAIKSSQGNFKSESIIRRLVYNFGGRFVGAAASYVMPVGLGGIGGRYARVVSGRFTSLRLKRMESRAKQVFLGDFQLDAKKVDAEVKKAARQNKIGLDKVARAIQAIAISDAPDYYALQKQSMDKYGLNYNDEGIAAAISFQNYSMDDIDKMLSSDDILNVMGANALRDTGQMYSVLSVHGTTVDGAQIMKPTKFTDRSAAEEFARKNNTSVIDLPVSHGEILQEFKTMSGATYAFGELSTATQDDLVTLAVNLLNSEILKDANDHVAIGSIAGGFKNDRQGLIGGMVEKILSNTFEKGLNPTEIGKVANASRYLRGDMTELYGKETYKRIQTGTTTWSSNYIDQLHEDGTYTRHYPASTTQNIIEQTTRVVPNEYSYLDSLSTNSNLTPQQALDARFYSDDISRKDIYRMKENKQKYTYGSSVKTESRVVGRKTVKGNFGTKQEAQFKRVKGQNKTYESHNRLHTSQSSDNPQRHNFIPNRRQIQSSVHIQDPEFDKEATVEINVAFGGRGPNSKTNDFIRDAFQIEMGGPATDRGGKLLNRTDMFVYTPSLLMYNAGLKAATAFGLNMSAKKPVGAVGSEQMKQFGMKFSGGNTEALLHGSTYKSTGRQDRIMQELYAKSRKDRLGNPIISNGRLMLEKSQVLRSNVDSRTLELLSDTIDDTLFGGKYFTKNRRNRKAFEPIQTGNPAADIKKAQQAARKQSDFRFGPDNAPDEFRDLFEYNIGQVMYEEPDIALYDVRVKTDARGQQIYEITGYKQQYGRGVGYGSARQQGVVSSDTAELAGGNAFDDLRLLRDADPDSEKFMDSVGLAKITRQLQSERINFNMREQIRTKLKARQRELGLDDVQVEMLVYRINNRMVRNYIAQAGTGQSALSAAELAILIDNHLTWIDTISDSIRRTGIYSHRFNKQGKVGQEKIQKITKGTREEAIMDAEFNTQSAAIFFDVDGFAEAMAPDSINKLIQQFEDGDIDSQALFYKMNSELEKSSTNFLKNIQRQDATGRAINSMEISGKKPKATPGTHYGSNKPERFGGTTNFNAGEKARKDASDYGLNTGNYRNQKKYVDRQISIAANTNLRGSMQFILDKISLNKPVRDAFNQVIIKEMFNGVPRDVTMQDIRDYIVSRTGNAIKFNEDIDNIITDLNTEDPTLFE